MLKRLYSLPLFIPFCLAFLVCIQNGGELYAKDAKQVMIVDGESQYRLGKFLSIYEDASHEKTIYEVIAKDFSSKFKQSNQENPNFGFSKSAYWLKFHIKNETTNLDNFMLEINFPMLDSVEFYYKENNRWMVKSGGDKYPFSTREFRNRHLLFNLKVPTWESRTFYMRVVSTNSQMQMPMTIWHPIAFEEHNHQSQFIFGIIYGIIFLIIMSDAFLFFTSWNRSYLYYVLAMLFSLLLIAALNGHAYEYLWRDQIWIQNNIFPLLLASLGFWLSLFCRHFLETKIIYPQLHTVLRYAAFIQAGIGIVSIFLPYDWAFYCVMIPSAMMAVLLIFTGIMGVAAGNVAARYFLVAFLIYGMGYLINVFKSVGAVQISFWTEYSAQFGAAVQVIVLSFALGVRLKELRREKAEAQRESLEAQQELNEQLENKVKERTIEIEQKAKELEKSYKSVEILSSIGQDITSTLKVEDIFAILYKHVHELMDASFFGIDIHMPEANMVEYTYNIEKDVRLGVERVSMDNPNNFSVWCIKNRQNILINDITTEYSRYIQKYEIISGESSYSAIFVPLIFGDKVLGVVTAQSFEKNAYTPQHLEIMETLASFTSIALANAQSYEEVSTVNTNLMHSIKYAQRIQEAIFSDAKLVIQSFRDAFIFYKPRDIVSGDFYWYGEVNGSKIIAAVDCTGHGVPGAFMTMMGNDLLNQIVIENDIVDPSVILKKLDEKVRSTLHTGEYENNNRNDGMDVSLCVVHSITRELCFAGAKSPLYYIPRGSSEVVVYKGSKFPVGGSHFREEKNYPTTIIKYQDGDRFYIFTDGYQDQFGGPSDFKYTGKRVRSLLQRICDLPMERQNQIIEQEHIAWRDKGKQTDDVLFVGVQV
ncbi:MAG: GAF domain-containing protein [Cytophagales bacterium]|nr:MAG: GAF domain-containing protein [Cytophagales bacterium]